jgi:predicted solute-binding protein
LSRLSQPSSAATVDALQAARALGETDADGVASRFFPGDPVKAAVGATYLRENIRFRLGDRERAGLERFFMLAVDVGVVERMQPLRWLEGR